MKLLENDLTPNDVLTIHVTEARAVRPAVFEVVIREGSVTLRGPLGIPTVPTTGNRCEQDGNPDNIWVDSTGFQWCVVADYGDYSMLVARYAIDLVGINGVASNRAHWETANT